MAGIVGTLTANSNIQGTGALLVEGVDAGINALANAYGAGGAVSLVTSVLGFLDPATPPPQGLTLQDVINKLSEFTTTVMNELKAIDKSNAETQVQTWSLDLNNALNDPGGVLSWLGEISTWKNDPKIGLPLPDGNDPNGPGCQASAHSTLSLLLGNASAPPPANAPTPYWQLPEGDLPLFNPDNPWTYYVDNLSARPSMFNESVISQHGIECNPYAAYETRNYDPRGGGTLLTQKVLPQFDFSALQFTTDFRPPPVPGVQSGFAFNPTWTLQLSMAAVHYYFLLCGACLKNFPNDGSTVHHFVGNDPNNPEDSNFLGELSWYHDQIRAGIVCIWPPFPTTLVPVGAGKVSPSPDCPDGLVAASADSGISWWSNPCMIYRDSPAAVAPFSYSFLSQLAANSPSSTWKRPFGALCSYNGFVAGLPPYGSPKPSVDSYPDYVYPTPGDPIYRLDPDFVPPAASLDWYNGFYCKYLVACLWRAKMVYNGMALGDMWRTINRLYVLFGQPPRPGPCFGDWSLSEVFRMLGSANYDTFPLPLQPRPGTSGSKFTVRAFLQFMSGAAPTPKTPLTSLRAALQGV